VQWRIDDAAALALLAKVRTAWRDAPPGLPADLGAHRDPSGDVQTRQLDACVRRAGIDPTSLAAVFEFGCGGGRVLRHLAARFASAAGCDLSPLRLAAAGPGAGALSLVDDLRFGMSEPFDLWYSHLALQSLPPPLIARVLRRALALLRPGGLAVFQLPTYAKGYSFDPEAPSRADPAADRHMLPQRVVFDIASAEGCVPAEVFEDLAVEPYPLWRSSVFVLRKHGG
jgi:SAM-dependent methyltransferase